MSPLLHLSVGKVCNEGRGQVNAAMMISQGENLKFIQSQLGHASTTTTLDRYGHILPEVSHGTGERLDDTVFGKSVSKVLAKPLSGDSREKEKAPEPVTVQGLSLVAGARSKSNL